MADIKRLNYFNGQFLKQEDFNDEQGYHIDMRRRLNRSLHTWGVADTGLQVSSVSGTTNQISIGAGMAIDNQGREIVLLTPQTKSLAGEPANSDVYVTVQYQETKTDPPTNSTDPTLFTRWTEQPKVEIVRTPPAADGAVVTLAKIRLDGTGNVVSPIDQSVRTIASSKIAPATNLQLGSLTWGNHSQLRIDQGGSIELGGDASTAGTGTPYIDFHFNGKTEDFNARIINDNDGMLTLHVPATRTTGKLITGGNVGIGTSSPSSALHVKAPASSNPIGALTIDVQSFGTMDNASASYFLQVRDIGAAPPNGFTHFFIRGDGNIGIGTSEPKARLDVRGHLLLDPGRSPIIYTGTGASELSRELRLLNSPDLSTASGLYAGGILISDDYGFANPGKNDLIVKGNVGIGTSTPNGIQLDIASSHGDAGNAAIRARYPAGAGLLNTEFAALAHRSIGWTALYAQQGAAAAAAFFHGNVIISTAGILSFANQTRQMINLWSTEYGIGIQGGTQYYRTATNFAWFKGGSHNDTTFNPGAGGARLMALNSAGDLILPSRTNPTGDPAASMCRALVDFDRKLYVNFANDFNLGTFIDSDLTVSRNAFKSGGGSWAATSDKRLKQKIKTLEGALDRLMGLRGVSFEWKAPEKQGGQSGPHIGLVAQEVEKVFPEWVGTGPDGYKFVSVYGFEALTIESFRELKNEIVKLQEQVASIETRVKALEGGAPPATPK
jgi:hypothetical protein